MVASSKLVELDEAVKRTAFAPGRTCGNRCVTSWPASVVSGSGLPPPAADTRERLLVRPPDNTIVSSSLQLPPKPPEHSQRSTAAPPWTGIFFIFPPAKNPIHWPSGEKNGTPPGFSV